MISGAVSHSRVIKAKPWQEPPKGPLSESNKDSLSEIFSVLLVYLCIDIKISVCLGAHDDVLMQRN